MNQSSKEFFCLKCDFKCAKKGDWNRHILTMKHQLEYVATSVNANTKMKPCNLEKSKSKSKTYACYCGEILNSRTTLWRHKKMCNQNPNFNQNVNLNENNPNNPNNLIIKLLSQNNDLQQMLMEQNKQLFELAKEGKIINNTTNNTNNTNNNHFNLQFFLNDTCKDALNLVDFVDSLDVNLKDLEETAQLGYSEGVSRIFINGLNELDINKRTIHCSDAKRETLYIKDQDEWTKEDTNKTKISKAIKKIGSKNIKQITEWQKKYPDYKNPDSKQNDQYLKMICNAMSGSTTEEQNKNMGKIIRNITKEVIIDKNIVS